MRYKLITKVTNLRKIRQNLKKEILLDKINLIHPSLNQNYIRNNTNYMTP